MGRIATVEIHNSKTDETRIVNASDFDAESDDWKGWKVKSERSKEELLQADAAAERGETSAPDAPADEPGEGDESGEDDKAPPVEDWTKMKWPQARSYIKSVTGTSPKNKTHAEELMAAPEDE